MPKFYFTFGCGQGHPNGYHVIDGLSHDAARAEMFRRFGQKWSMQYSEDEWRDADGATQAERYSLHEVK